MHQKSSLDSTSSASRHPQSDEDIVIAVMGMTGSGKSSWINLLADEKVKVGHSLQSCTTEVQIASFNTKPGRPVYLIDTPGFDDTHRSDTDILKEIAAFLTKLYLRKFHVTGLVYVHRITDPKMQGSAVKNLAVFQKLCGIQCFPQVALVSTMWQELHNAEGQATGQEREAELRSKDAFWGAMDKAGSRTFRHSGRKESAEEVIQWFLQFRHKVVLNIQRELVDDEMTLDRTEAGRFLQETSAQVKERYEKEIRQLQFAIDDAHQEKDSQTENELLLQRSDAEAALEKADQNSKDMQINVQQLETEKAAEYITRVEEMERERDSNMNREIHELQGQLKRVEADSIAERQQSYRREKELRQQTEAIRRQDTAKAREQIVRLEAELSRVEAQSREKTKAFQDLAGRLQAESSLRSGNYRVLEFMRHFAHIYWDRREARSLFLEEDRIVMSPRRVATSDSLQSMRPGGSEGRSRHER